jgi:hypothetical protein
MIMSLVRRSRPFDLAMLPVSVTSMSERSLQMSGMIGFMQLDQAISVLWSESAALVPTNEMRCGVGDRRGMFAALHRCPAK